jgi:hypothetical protein
MSDVPSSDAQTRSAAELLNPANPAAPTVRDRHFLPVATSVDAIVAVAAAESTAARPGKIANVADCYVVSVRADEIVAIAAIGNLLDDANAGAEAFATASAVAAVPNM